MKRIIMLMFSISLFVFGLVEITEISADTPNNKVVYFYSPTCLGCQSLIDDGYIIQIQDAGIEIIYMNVDDTYPTNIPENIVYNEDEDLLTEDIRFAFSNFYEVPDNKRATPLMFVGDTYYYDSEIGDAIENGEFFDNAALDFLEVNIEADAAYNNIKGFIGFLSVLGAGLLDGFNPCAIALLLMFISLVGFTENKKVLIIVSVTYILTMFLSYLLIGLGLLTAVESFVKGSIILDIVQWVIFVLVVIFFFFNVYDFIVSRNEDYGKIKNQLPKWIQRMNKRIMKTFAASMNEEGTKGNLWAVVLLTFSLGVIMSLTEFLCTGQIYGGIILGISHFKEAYAYFALISYNFMFVLPMIVIAVISVKSESINSVSNWIREHLHIIKLLNALLFLGIAIYYGFRIFKG